MSEPDRLQYQKENEGRKLAKLIIRSSIQAQSSRELNPAECTLIQECLKIYTHNEQLRRLEEEVKRLKVQQAFKQEARNAYA